MPPGYLIRGPRYVLIHFCDISFMFAYNSAALFFIHLLGFGSAKMWRLAGYKRLKLFVFMSQSSLVYISKHTRSLVHDT